MFFGECNVVDLVGMCLCLCMKCGCLFGCVGVYCFVDYGGVGGLGGNEILVEILGVEDIIVVVGVFVGSICW